VNFSIAGSGTSTTYYTTTTYYFSIQAPALSLAPSPQPRRVVDVVSPFVFALAPNDGRAKAL
jgi:hypothetical protein